MSKYIASIVAVLLISSTTFAELQGTFPTEGGYLTLSSPNGPTLARTLEMVAPQGVLTAGAVSAPFQSSTTFASGKVEFYGGLSPVTIDGYVTLDLQVAANATPQGRYETDVAGKPTLLSFPISAGDTPQFTIAAQRPYAGGAITLAPFEGTSPVSLRGIEFNAVRGELSSGGNAAPFASLDTNTPTNWSASSSANVTIDGPTELDLIASATSTINGTFNDGTATGQFRVRPLPPPVDSQIVGRYSIEGGPISVQSTRPVSLRQLQLNSAGGNLIGGTNAAPFENVVSNTDTEWAVVSNVDVVLNGSVDLDVQVQPNTFVKGFTSDGVKTSAFQLYALTQEELNAELFGIFPEDGGLMTVITTKGPIQTGGIEFESQQAGSLVPSDVPAPFSFFLPSNNNPRITALGVLGTPVTLDGPVTLGIEVSPTAVVDIARWGKGVKPTDFPVVGGLLDTGLTREPDRLTGSYSLAGGPVSVRATGEAVPLREIQLVASKGKLIDTGNAAPFESVTASDEVWKATSSADVTIDGEVVLGVEVAPFSLVSGIGNTSDDTFAFSLNSFTEDVIESELVAVFPEEGGKVTVFATDEPITTDSIEFATEDIGAITAGFDPAPFDFFLSDPNKPGNIILGMNSGTVTIDGSLTLDITASADAELFGTWGEGVLSTFPVVGVPNVPEPNSSSLAWFALTLSLALRRCRSRRGV